MPQLRDKRFDGAGDITLKRMQMPFAASLVSEWLSLPAEVRRAPASLEQLEEFERAYGPIPLGYRQFLQHFGGGPVGSEWIDGIEQLAESHNKFRRECGPNGWRNSQAFVIGWDGGGNPIEIDVAGAVVVEDHNSGDVHRLAASFEEFLAKGLGHAL